MFLCYSIACVNSANNHYCIIFLQYWPLVELITTSSCGCHWKRSSTSKKKSLLRFVTLQNSIARLRNNAIINFTIKSRLCIAFCVVCMLEFFILVYIEMQYNHDKDTLIFHKAIFS